MGSTAPPHGDAVAAMWACDTLEKATGYLSENAPIELQNYISGTFTTPGKPTSGIGTGTGTCSAFIDSHNPKTGRVIARVPCSQPEDVDAAIQDSRQAFPAWSKTTRAQRSAYLRRVSELLQEHRELFAVWESIYHGKTLARARVEVDRAVANFS